MAVIVLYSTQIKNRNIGPGVSCPNRPKQNEKNNKRSNKEHPTKLETKKYNETRDNRRDYIF